MLKICVLYGGTSSERDVSIRTGKAVIDSICKDHDVFMYDFDGDYNILYKKIKDVDLVFIALHGGDGENGTIQKYLESKNIKFTGSGSQASKNAMNKNQTKKLCKKYKIPTPKWFLTSQENYNPKKKYYDNLEDFKTFTMYLIKNHLGLVIKPNNEGSSVGVTIFKEIESQYERFQHQNKLIRKATLKGIKVSGAMIWEEYIEGREVTVSILDNKVLPIVEIIPKGEYYDYNCKYTEFQSDYVVPAKINKETEELLSSYSLKIHKLIGCGTYSRVDFRLAENGEIYFLEINTLPGFTNVSLFPKSALAAKICYNELINKIIKLAL